MRVKASLRIIALLGALAAAPGCGTQADTMCDLLCECEHCNDYDEDLECIRFHAQEDAASTYECADEWEKYATCYEDKGRCEETEANFTLSSGGSCSGQQPVGVSCVTDPDCNVGGGVDATCQGGMCVIRVCAGNGGPCDRDEDCPGVSLCQSQEEALYECVIAASAHNGPLYDLFGQ